VTNPDWKPLQGKGIPEGCKVQTYLDRDGDVHVRVAKGNDVVFQFWCMAWIPGVRGRIPRRIRRFFRTEARKRRRLEKVHRKIESLQGRALHREEKEEK